MPEITINLAAGRTDEQKKGMMLDITQALVKNLGVTADAVVIQINEAPLNNKMKGGQTFVERAAAAAKKRTRSKRSNDSLRGRQWSLDRLRAEQVWRKSKGRGVVVAVIDTGVQADHPDLKGRVLKGRDFVERDRNAADRNGHGTHVAGVIAAKAGNRRGIAGLAPKARILPVRVLNSAGAGNTADVSWPAAAPLDSSNDNVASSRRGRRISRASRGRCTSRRRGATPRSGCASASSTPAC